VQHSGIYVFITGREWAQLESVAGREFTWYSVPGKRDGDTWGVPLGEMRKALDLAEFVIAEIVAEKLTP
jgi:hypothetical protein